MTPTFYISLSQGLQIWLIKPLLCGSLNSARVLSSHQLQVLETSQPQFLSSNDNAWAACCLTRKYQP